MTYLGQLQGVAIFKRSCNIKEVAILKKIKCFIEIAILKVLVKNNLQYNIINVAILKKVTILKKLKCFIEVSIYKRSCNS